MLNNNSIINNINNNSIINNINKVCNINNGAYVADPREVFQAALHCFYFMRPSQARDKFVEDLGYIFVDTLEDAKAVKTRTNADLYDSMIYAATRELLIQLTECFDLGYFKSQTKVLDSNAVYDKSLVGKLLRSLTKEQLYEYLELVGCQNFNGQHFMSTEAFLDMWNEFDDECSKVDEFHGNMKNAIIANFECDDDEYADEDPIITFDIPYINEKTAEVFETVNPLYFFDYLSTETIIRVFEKHVDGDMEMLAFLTAAFCSADCKTAMCLSFAMCEFWNAYTLFALDMDKSPERKRYFDERYIEFLVSCAKSERESKEKFNYFLKND